MTSAARCLLVALGVVGVDALGCTCGDRTEPRPGDFVFTGVASSVTARTKLDPAGEPIRTVEEICFDDVQHVRGPGTPSCVVQGRGDCVYRFEVGERYVVHASNVRGEPPFGTSSCHFNDRLVWVGDVWRREGEVVPGLWIQLAAIFTIAILGVGIAGTRAARRRR